MRTFLSLTAAATAGAALFLAATTTSTEAGAPGPAAAPFATDYDIDAGHSTVMFRCKHLDLSYVWGRFDKFSGAFTLAEDASDSSVEIVIDAASVNSNSDGRDKHLRGPDFFAAKEFPDMTFQSTSVSAGVSAGKDDVFTITGDLTIRGKASEVKFDVQKIGEADTRMGRRAGFEGSFVVDRMAFGIDAYGEMLGHDVTMTFAIEGVQPK